MDNEVIIELGAKWLSGRVLDSRPRDRGFEPHRSHCVVSLSKKINPSLVLVQTRKTRSFIIERLLMGRKESNKKKVIIEVDSHKHLGVFLSNDCTWHKHIDYVKEKAWGRINVSLVLIENLLQLFILPS